MMTDTKDGGPAFPREAYVNPNGTTIRTGSDGMSLRDWFAGQALTGILGPNYDWFTSGDRTGSRAHEAAYFAYSLADAMLAARGARHD
jgi:hypothetical protein